MRNLKEMELLTQKGPACGTTSLAMIIRFLTKDNTVIPENIDKEIRRLPWMFNAPRDLITYARKKGLRAEEYNHNSLQQIEDLIGQGIPVMPLLDLTPDNALDLDKWHWVVVVGVEKINGRKRLIVNNPWGEQEEWEQEKFLREWAHLKLLGLNFGYSNYLIAVGMQEHNLPACSVRGVAGANATTKGLADVLNGFARVCHNRDFKGLGQLLWGVVVLFYGIGCIILSNIFRRTKPVSRPKSGQECNR